MRICARRSSPKCAVASRRTTAKRRGRTDAFAYYERYREGGEHPLYCRTPRDGGAETVLLDGDALAEGYEFFDIRRHGHSPDHAQLAWSVDDKGSELYSIRTRALADGGDRADVVTTRMVRLSGALDAASFYYVRDRREPSHRASLPA